ncbi:hypothetical protein E2562_000998, partial [Oryza meyeriana var. granulata]
VPSCRSSAGTKWYINIDIPVVNAFRASLQGRGCEVLLLPSAGDAALGNNDEANANRKSISELLSLNPHDNNDVRFTCDACIKEIDVSSGWWYKGCSICRKGVKPTLQGFECVNCDTTVPIIVPSYKLNVVIKDSTGRAKIFMFGGVAEQVVRRTATDLVEKSSSNQILLPSPLRALIGRKYVFQVVISEQTFRTGQLCFQARRVFNPPPIDGQQDGAHATPGENPGNVVTFARTSGAGNKESMIQSSGVTEIPVDPKGSTTPPPLVSLMIVLENSPQKGNEIPEEHGTPLAKRFRSTRKELFSTKKGKARKFT